MREPTTGARAWLTLTKPGVVVLLQVTALCAVLCHDMLAAGGFSGMNWGDSAQTMAVVFVGGYLTAGGANSINMWYDRDIDPIMARTANRPIPTGAISANAALAFGVLISIAGVAWFVQFGNEVAAFWAAFSILFYVFIYSMWLKRNSVQNIVIGGLAGATPPVPPWFRPSTPPSPPTAARLLTTAAALGPATSGTACRGTSGVRTCRRRRRRSGCSRRQRRKRKRRRRRRRARRHARHSSCEPSRPALQIDTNHGF